MQNLEGDEDDIELVDKSFNQQLKLLNKLTTEQKNLLRTEGLGTELRKSLLLGSEIET